MKEATVLRRFTPQSLLPDISLFEGSKRAQLRDAAKLLTEVHVRPGKVLLTEGSSASQFLIVADGLVKVTTADGDEVRELAVLTTGDVLGEMSLLYDVPRTATAVALTYTVVLAATPQEFWQLMHSVPSAADYIHAAAERRTVANLAA